MSLANNAGTLETIGKITDDGAPFKLAPRGGFDIVSAKDDKNLTLSILQMRGAAFAGLYGITPEFAALIDGGVVAVPDEPEGGAPIGAPTAAILGTDECVDADFFSRVETLPPI